MKEKISIICFFGGPIITVIGCISCCIISFTEVGLNYTINTRSLGFIIHMIQIIKAYKYNFIMVIGGIVLFCIGKALMTKK